jgi:hypothetical protein
MSTTPDPITAELIVTVPDVEQRRRAALAAAAVADGARIYMSAAGPPWLLKASQGGLSATDWRERLIVLAEVLLPGEAARAPLADHLDQIAELAERCANLHAATTLPLRPEMHLEALTPALKDIATQLRAIYVAVAGENPWEGAPDEA